MIPTLADVATLTRHVLDAGSAGEAKPSLDRLVAALCQVTDVELHPSCFRDDRFTMTPHGKAVSLTVAAQCAEDVERSRVFMQGIFQAINERLENGQDVHLLYAGTGPFGMLVVPLLPFLDPARLQVTLLDIHRESLDKLDTLIDFLGARPFIASLECADATTWSPPPGQSFDLIVSETMKHLLQHEPQVRVFSHLQQFLGDGGALIPQRVTLAAHLADTSDPLAERSGQQPLGEFFVLDRNSAARIQGGDESVFSCYLPVPDYPAECRHLKLTTAIQVYGDHRLVENQSQLTLPRYRMDARLQPGSELHCRYLPGSYPDWDVAYQSLPTEYDNLVGSNDSSALGVAHLKRLWQKAQREKYGLESSPVDEWDRDRLLLENLFPTLYAGFDALYQSDSVETLERQIEAAHKQGLSPRLVERINHTLTEAAFTASR